MDDLTSLFGPHPFVTDPQPGGHGPNGEKYNYNSEYFATDETADKVARLLGGHVVAIDALTPLGPFKQNEPNLMVQLPDGKLVNAGLIANLWSKGYDQPTVDRHVSEEIGFEWHYTVPTPAGTLMSCPVDWYAQQADGTVWKRWK